MTDSKPNPTHLKFTAFSENGCSGEARSFTMGLAEVRGMTLKGQPGRDEAVTIRLRVHSNRGNSIDLYGPVVPLVYARYNDLVGAEEIIAPAGVIESASAAPLDEGSAD